MLRADNAGYRAVIEDGGVVLEQLRDNFTTLNRELEALTVVNRDLEFNAESAQNALDLLRTQVEGLRIQYDFSMSNIGKTMRNGFTMSFLMTYEFLIVTIMQVLGEEFANPDNLNLLRSTYQDYIFANHNIYSRFLNGDLSFNPSNVDGHFRPFFQLFKSLIMEKETNKFLINKVSEGGSVLSLGQDSTLFNLEIIKDNVMRYREIYMDSDTNLTLENVTQDEHLELLNIEVQGNIRANVWTSISDYYKERRTNYTQSRRSIKLANLYERFESSEFIQVCLNN